MASEAGKGSVPRPKQVSDEQYAQAWDLIFGRDEVEVETPVEYDLPQQPLSEH